MAESTHNLHDLVLARVGNYPPWPAKVSDPSAFQRPEKAGEVFVLFFFPHQVRYCAPTDVLPFSGVHRAAAEAQAHRDDCQPEFKKAFALCQEEYNQRTAQASAHEESGEPEADDPSSKSEANDENPRETKSAAPAKKRKSAAVRQPIEDQSTPSSGTGTSAPRRSSRLVSTPDTPPKVLSASKSEGKKKQKVDTSVEPKAKRARPERSGQRLGDTGQEDDEEKGVSDKSPQKGRAPRGNSNKAQKVVEEKEDDAVDANSDDEASDSEDDDDDDDDFVTRKKPAPKKARAKDSASPAISAKKAAPTATRGRSADHAQKKTATSAPAKKPVPPDNSSELSEEDEVVPEDSLSGTLEKLQTGTKKQITACAKAWADAWESDARKAEARFLHLLLKLCGAPVAVGVEELLQSDVDVDSVVQRQVVEAKDESVDFFTNKGKPVKKFRQNLVDFLSAMVMEAQSYCLFGKDVGIEHVLDFATALSCSSPRTFRVAATSVALDLVSILIGIALQLSGQRETLQRQLQAEERKQSALARSKKGKGANSEAVSDLRKQVDEVHSNISHLESLMRKGFTGVLMHRYRDVDASIRQQCIESLGNWITEYTSLFLQDTYTKYIGWMLSDKVSGVRLAAIQALEVLYEDTDNIPALAQFSDRFTPRILDMAYDVDDDCAVAALELLQVFLQHELVKPDDIINLGELAVYESAEVRRSAAAILLSAHMAQDPPSVASPPPSTKRKGKAKQDETAEAQREVLCVARMVQPFANQPLLCSYVVHALWGTVSGLQDWELLCGLLDSKQDEVPRGDAAEKHTKSLTLLLACCAAKAVGSQPSNTPGGAAETKKKDSPRKKLEAARKEMTTAVAPHLPALLQRFAGDSEITSMLLSVALHLDLEVFALKQDEEAFESVLMSAKSALLRHVLPTTQEAAAQVLCYYAESASPGMTAKAVAIAGEAVADVAEALKSAAAEAQNGASELSESTCDPVEMGIALQRLLCLLKVSDCSLFIKAGSDSQNSGSEDGNQQDVLLDSLLRLFEATVLLNLLKTASSSLECMQLLLFWSVKSLMLLPPEKCDTAEENGLAARGLERARAVRESLSRLLPKVISLDLEEAGEDTDIESDAERCTTIVKVLEIATDFYCVLCPGRVKSSVCEPLSMPMRDKTLRAFWAACEHVIAAFEKDDMDNQPADGQEGSNQLQKGHVLRAAFKLFSSGAAQQPWLAAAVLSHCTALEDEPRPEVKRIMVAILHTYRKSLSADRSSAHESSPAKKTDSSEAAGKVLLEALKLLYARYLKVLADDPDADERTNQRLLVVPCHDLSRKFLHAFVGMSKDTLAPLARVVVTGAVDYAFSQGISTILFLPAGILPFAGKLPAADIKAVISSIQSKLRACDEDLEGIQKPCDDVVTFLQQRSSKADPESAAKSTPDKSPSMRDQSTPVARASKDKAYSGLRRKKLSFQSAASDMADHRDEEEQDKDTEMDAADDGGEEEETNAAEEVEEVPAAGLGSENLAAWGKSVRKPKAATPAGKSYSRRKRMSGSGTDMSSPSSAHASPEGASIQNQRDSPAVAAPSRLPQTQGSEDLPAAAGRAGGEPPGGSGPAPSKALNARIAGRAVEEEREGDSSADGSSDHESGDDQATPEDTSKQHTAADRTGASKQAPKEGPSKAGNESKGAASDDGSSDRSSSSESAATEEANREADAEAETEEQEASGGAVAGDKQQKKGDERARSKTQGEDESEDDGWKSEDVEEEETGEGEEDDWDVPARENMTGSLPASEEQLPKKK